MRRFPAYGCLLVGVTICAACDHPITPIPPSDVKPAASSTASARVVTMIEGAVFDMVGRTVGGATVKIVDGPLAGTSTVSDAAGKFSFAGTFTKDATLTASVDGYQTDTQAMALANGTGPVATVFFSLASAAPSVHLDAGTYDLTFISDPTCDGIPDDQRTLSFSTAVSSARDQPRDSFYFVDITSGPTQLGFGLASFGNVLEFEIDMPILKIVTPNTQISFTAFSQTTVPTLTPSTVTFPASGVYDYCVFPTAPTPGTWTNCDILPAGSVVKHVSCRSQNHQLVLAKR